MDEDQISKNSEALRIMGIRNEGKPSTPLFVPSELGYYCPICHKKCKKCSSGKYFEEKHLINESETLNFSEYSGFLWCKRCNIDIPSALCLRIIDAESAKKATEIFLKSVEDAQKYARTNPKNKGNPAPA